MHILAVYAHPSRKSFNRALLDVLLDVAGTKGHKCEVLDLYADGFQPSLTEEDFAAFDRGNVPEDVQRMQDAVNRSDIVVFIHPIWWFGLPAIMKGWIDRVFSYGFAYSHDSRGVKPLLTGKKAIIVNTAGGAETTGYDDTGYKSAMIKLTDVGIYNFVGLDVILRRMFFQVPIASDEERRDMLGRFRMDLQKML